MALKARTRQKVLSDKENEFAIKNIQKILFKDHKFLELIARINAHLRGKVEFFIEMEPCPTCNTITPVIPVPYRLGKGKGSRNRIAKFCRECGTLAYARYI